MDLWTTLAGVMTSVRSAAQDVWRLFIGIFTYSSLTKNCRLEVIMKVVAGNGYVYLPGRACVQLA